MAALGATMNALIEAIRCRWCHRWMLDIGGLAVCPSCDADTLTIWRAGHA